MLDERFVQAIVRAYHVGRRLDERFSARLVEGINSFVAIKDLVVVAIPLLICIDRLVVGGFEGRVTLEQSLVPSRQLSVSSKGLPWAFSRSSSERFKEPISNC